jgi:hypothetical protein
MHFFLGDLEDPDSRYQCGASLLRGKSSNGHFNVQDMMAVLRDEPSGICRPDGAFPTAGSQVSLLSKGGGDGGGASCHWFTATPSPVFSVFKPFLFDDNPSSAAPLPASFANTFCIGERSSSTGSSSMPDNRQHPLWAAHASARIKRAALQQQQQLLAALEAKYHDVGLLCRKQGFQPGRNIFAEAVDEEMELYSSLKSTPRN